MVDLKLEALDLQDSAKDMYIAVRVGEVQKLSRLSNSRNYKFSQATVGDRKFAKVDVFRRVGSASIGIKNASTADSVEEVSVRIREQDPLKFKVHLAPESQEKRKVQIDKMAAAESNSKVLEAKHYLVEHNLEDRLSQAMQAVLRERPQDPGQFIADLLKKTANDYVKLAPASPATSVWSQKPSIGTWLGKPCRTSSSSAEPEIWSPEIWSQKPSIGTCAEPETSAATSLSFSQAHEALLKGAQDGSLQKALDKLSPQMSRSVQDLRKECHEAMLKGAQNGSLQKVLEETLRNAAPNIAPMSSKAEALRQEAKETIIKACNDGLLESTLQEAISSMGKDSVPTSGFPGKPSVGTWLVPRYTQKAKMDEVPAKMAAPVETASTRPLAMIPLQCLYGGAFASTGIRPNFVLR